MTFDLTSNYGMIVYITNLSPVTGVKFSLLFPCNTTGNFTKIVQRIPQC